jgi:phosphoesterase RecJ-like protein
MLNYVKADAAANCQNMYHVICALGAEITPEIATALYMGLSTDTGNFLFDNVTSETLRIAAELKDCGADTNALRLNIYESSSHKRIALLKYILNDLHISRNGKYAWSKLHYDMMQELQPESTDIDGLINTIKDIDGVEVAMLFRGVGENKTKVSLRSKAWADVNAIANQFGGGGHIRAAGCSFECAAEPAAEQLVPAVQKYIEETEQH